jgi:chromosome segregation ATPase
MKGNRMADYNEDGTLHYANTRVEARTPAWLIGIAAAGLVLALASLGWATSLHNHLAAEQRDLTAANERSQSLNDQLQQTNDRLQAQGQTLAQSVGLTQKQLEDKSNELIAAQHATAANTARLQREQSVTKQQVASVQQDVSGVKTDVTGVKSDVATQQADLAAAKSQMTQMMGDEGKMSGFIATNHTELEELKHRGDRDYYEFTLTKGAAPTLLSTVKIQLKKLNEKHSRFTLNVSSDDRSIEKKDKTLDEPIQFYSGKSPLLFEVVINNIGKNTVSGYLSTPKSAPKPVTAD